VLMGEFFSFHYKVHPRTQHLSAFVGGCGGGWVEYDGPLVLIGFGMLLGPEKTS
jgi:hypothetical protein